jgi:hypothetical protein
LVAGISLLVSLICGLGLIFRIDVVNQYWPWTLLPLVGALIGVLFITHTAAYTWALWDGDWVRTRPMFWQAPVTALMFILLPLLHGSDLRPDAGASLALYYTVAGFVFLANLGVILGYRAVEKDPTCDGS